MFCCFLLVFSLGFPVFPPFSPCQEMMVDNSTKALEEGGTLSPGVVCSRCLFGECYFFNCWPYITKSIWLCVCFFRAHPRSLLEQLKMITGDDLRQRFSSTQFLKIETSLRMHEMSRLLCKCSRDALPVTALQARPRKTP